MESAETLKLRAALIQEALKPPAAQDRKDYLLFLVEAGLITDPHDKIKNLNANKIPHTFGFIPSAALTPELVSTLDNRLTKFRDYLLTIGLRADTTPKVNIRADEEARTGMICHYEPEAEGGSQLVIDAQYAEDADLALREYCHHVMAANRPAGEPKYSKEDDGWKTYWPHFAIESALAFYLPCSSHSNSRFAEGAVRKGVSAINLARAHKLTELKADEIAMYYEDAEIWGSLFWELRTKFGAQKVDGLLTRAWFTLNENTPAEAQTKAFANAILQGASQQLEADAVAEIKKIFKARGLRL